MATLAADPASSIVTPDVAEFSASRGLGPTIELAIRLARECFSPVQRLSTEMDNDPETGEEGVAVVVGVSMPVEQVLRCQSAFSRQWAESVVPDVRHLVRIMFHVI